MTSVGRNFPTDLAVRAVAIDAREPSAGAGLTDCFAAGADFQNAPPISESVCLKSKIDLTAYEIH